MKKLIKIGFLIVLVFSFITVDAQRKRSSKTKKQTTSKSKKAKSSKKSSRGNKKNTAAKEESQPQQEVLKLSKDTTTPNVVTITSAFKPSLRTAAKINFTATAPELDTNRFAINYNIPAQNLFFSYQPVPIKPLALTADSVFEWQNHQYVKLGFGNYSTPYFETGLSFGHPSKAQFLINGKFVSSKGNLPFQENTNAALKLSTIVGSIPNHEFTANLSYTLSNQYRYGVKQGFVFVKDDLQQNFNTIEAAIGLHTKSENSFGITYHPQIKASLFSDNKQGKETNIFIKAPLTKKITETFKVNLEVMADITSYTTPLAIEKISNNIFSVSPSLIYNNKDLKLNAGLLPSWNNQEFKLLPNVTAEYHLSADRLLITAGMIGYFQKNNYKYLASINPFISQPTNLINTQTNEIYGGVKAGIGKHFTANGQISFLKFINKALFVNNAIDNKSQNFDILYEPNLKAFSISGEVGYTTQEKLSLLASVKFTQFTAQELYPKAYGIIPLEITGSARYKLMKDFFVKSDLFFGSGSFYRVQTIQSEKTSAAFDLNLGAEYKVLNKLNVYLDFNNLFNNQYQRWNQYNVFGFNVVGGVVYSFH